MTINIFNSAVAETPCETHEYSGTLAGFLSACGIEYTFKTAQPISVSINGNCVDCVDWNSVYISSDDIVEIRVIPRGLVGAVVAVVAALFVAVAVLKPKVPNVNVQRNETPKGNQLEVSNASANTAKLNQTVPELAGRFIRYPEHLVPPRRYFNDLRTQYQEMLLCVGVGHYDIDLSSVKVGTTPLNNLDGAEFQIYEPGQDVTGLGTHSNWYPCPEVGGTSAGTAGLELTAAPSSDLEPIASSYTFNGKTVSTPSPLPNGWVIGTTMQIRITRKYSAVDDAGAVYSVISGSFVDIAHLAIGDIVSSRVGETLRIVSKSLDSAGTGTATFDYLNEFDVWLPVKVTASSEVGFWFADPQITLSITAISQTSATYKAVKNNADFAGWLGFGSIVSLPQNVNFIVSGAAANGDWSGPFYACPVSESASNFEVDIFFPRGLCGVNNSGGLYNYSVSVEIEYRNSGGAWQRISKTYTAATMDQIGFTEKLTLPVAGTPEVRLRRRGAVSTSTQIYDEVEWYGLRALLKTPTSYEGWTTLGVRFKGLGKIGAGSENKINLVATRKLQVLQADGTLSEAQQATRDASAFALYIARSVGYSLDDWDMPELLRLHALWVSRGETLDYVFTNTTVQNALSLTLDAAMSELTIDGGKLTPVRDGVRTVYEQVYSAQNTTTGFNRTFKLPRVDSNDGVLIEFIDAQDGYSAKTIECVLPGKAGVRLQTIRAEGVVGRTRAWRIGMRKARELEYENLQYSFTTELDAMNSKYGSYVALVPDIAHYGMSGQILAVGEGGLLTLSEPVTQQEGAVVAWRDNTGRFVGPHQVLEIVDEFNIRIASTVQPPKIFSNMELPHFFYGTSNKLTFPAIVRKITPNTNGQCAVQAVGYDARIYADDNNTPAMEL